MVLHDVADDPDLVKVPAQPCASAHSSVTDHLQVRSEHREPQSLSHIGTESAPQTGPATRSLPRIRSKDTSEWVSCLVEVQRTLQRGAHASRRGPAPCG
jgi:hypothetical protein